MRKGYLWPSLFALVFLALGAGLTWRSVTLAQQEVLPPENRPVQVHVGDYVTSNSCRSCHAGNYESWHSSFHRTMTQPATPENFATDPAGLELSSGGWDYKIEKRGNAYFVSKRRHGENPGGKSQRIVLLTGSHNLQVLWLESGAQRTLEQFPFAYIIAEKMWAPVVATFLVPPGIKELYSLGSWNGACMDCHVTQGRSRFVRGDSFDSDVAEFGIACEACHSEGSRHIAVNRNPVRRFAYHWQKKSDPTITNPAHLKGPESALACGQCHSVWAFTDMTNKIDFNRHGRNYRAGQDDLGQRFVVQPAADDHQTQLDFIRRTEPEFFRNRFWPDGMIRVTGRELNGVQRSPCFRGGDFSCLSCHEMHTGPVKAAALQTWRQSQLRPGMETDAACLQCHQQISGKVAAHTHHGEQSPGSRCYNCHMPQTTFGLLRTMHTHQISVPSVQESVVQGRPNACNLCHLDRPLQWTAEKMQAWYQQTPPPLSEDDRTIAAGVQWALKGDAAQRAIVLSGMGGKPAQTASGTQWLYPFLIDALGDPYAAVRFVSWKSLQTLPGFAGFDFSYTSEEKDRAVKIAAAYQKWNTEIRRSDANFPPATTLDDKGQFRLDIFQRLRGERDETPVLLAE